MVEGWTVPLRQRRGAPRRMHGITILHDFQWGEVFSHDLATFRNGKSLAALVLESCPKGKEPILLLTRRTDVVEGQMDDDEKYVIVVNIDNYLSLASGNAATTYFSMLASVDPVSMASINWDSLSREQIVGAFASRLDHDMLTTWLGEDPSRLKVVIEAIRSVTSNLKAVVEGRETEVMGVLVDLLHDDVWQALVEVGAELPEALVRRRLWQQRTNDVATFRSRLEANDWTEPDWQTFFEERTWIFGYGLRYQFLHQLYDRPDLGNRDVRGQGGQVSDFLMSTAAAARFTVLVDIKTPGADLVQRVKYRNQTHAPGSELVGGVAQVQQQVWQWATEGWKTINNIDLLDRQGIFTHEPHGILVIGNLASLRDDRSKLRSFESFRRKLIQPEILTFDELLARAEQMVNEAEEPSA